LKQAADNLITFFGRDRLLGSVTPGETDDFRVDLSRRLGFNTTARMCGRARQLFRVALRKRLITENPFADMKGCGVNPNAERSYFVTREEADAVLKACPNAEWRLLFVLSRYGGLRCPSDHLLLEWVRRRLGARENANSETQDSAPGEAGAVHSTLSRAPGRAGRRLG
jgi:hypothetical protein